MRVYYLTGAQFALNNLALRRIKIARFEDLNDPFELLGVDIGDKEYRAAFRATKEQISESKGLICFSKSWSNPLMWGHYAEKHTGMCLGFDVPEKLLAPVIYAKRLLKMEFDPKTSKAKPTKKFMDQLLRTKFFDWKYENEMRLFVELDHDTVESGKYFYSFSGDLMLREVILGPRCELPIEGVRNIVADLKPPVVVLKSRIAFTRFEVRMNKVASRTITRG
ncbi:MAG: hypothetical protein A3G20_02820 [Acidobacteria bacterium RIFCSPLOWO2_12_FULL_59_11]|nr:MAG: hypothetical protein A3G20_02820 [Acidobacteria bacterium RIFCSPLOWO2_12_FULL_59_11]